MVDTDLLYETGFVAGAALLSGFLFRYVHNTVHSMYGTGSTVVIALSALLGVLAVAGYYIWVMLSEVEYNKVIAALTFASMAAIHYLSHGYLPSFQAVGGIIFFTAAAGTVLNYVLRPDGIEL